LLPKFGEKIFAQGFSERAASNKHPSRNQRKDRSIYPAGLIRSEEESKLSDLIRAYWHMMRLYDNLPLPGLTYQAFF
jgi:hypothetical protein